MRARVVLLASLLFVPRPAAAQWYAAAYLGGNHTMAADVSVDVPAAGLAVTFHDVKFTAEPLTSPHYYGVRVGRRFGARGRFGLEAELIHVKVIAQTGDVYGVTGTFGVVPGAPGQPMNATVQAYSMTHGMNFVLVNFVARAPVADRPLWLVTRVGAGPAVPHAESSVAGIARGQCEYGGLVAHLAGGIEARLAGRMSVVGEYQLTYVRLRTLIAGGTSRTTAASHHISVGVAFELTR